MITERRKNKMNNNEFFNDPEEMRNIILYNMACNIKKHFKLDWIDCIINLGYYIPDPEISESTENNA